MSNQIITIDCQSTNAGINLTKSLRNTGFAILSNHSLDVKLIKAVYKEWNIFFKSDLKHSYLFHPINQDGYFPFKSENAKGQKIKDLKEFYHYYKWGRHPELLSNNTEKIFNKLIKFGKNLLKWIDLNTPKYIKKNYSMPLYNMIDGSDMNLLRIIHYPPIINLQEKDAIRAAPHEDINLITLLSPGSEPGLQVMSKDGNWIDVNCNPEWLVINTGDMLNECSSGYFPSTTHRVINPNKNASNISRFTIPLFIHPRKEVKLSKKYTAESFLNERLKEIGLRK